MRAYNFLLVDQSSTNSFGMKLVDPIPFRFSLCGSVPEEIFAIKVECCQISSRFLDIYTI